MSLTPSCSALDHSVSIAMNALSLAGRALRVVLPDVLDHLTTFFPHALDLYIERPSTGYDSLMACALVCREWIGPAQIALFTTAVVVRTTSVYVAEPDLPGADASIDSFLFALCAHPELGLTVRSLAIVCSSKLLERVRRVLSACTNVSTLNLQFYGGDLTCVEQLSHLSVMPSVRALGTNVHRLMFDLKVILGLFPSLVVLHSIALFDASCRPERLPSDSTILHITEIDSLWCQRLWFEYFSRVCVDPGIQILRVNRLENIDDAILFKKSLLDLYISELNLPQREVDRLAEFTSLRRLCLRQTFCYPKCWPPNLEILVVGRDFIKRQTIDDIRALVKQAPALNRVIMHHAKGTSPAANVDRSDLTQVKAFMVASGVTFIVREEVRLLL